MIKMFCIVVVSTLLLISFTATSSRAQTKPNAGKEKFYEALSHKKLFTSVPPRLKSRFSQNSLELGGSGSGGCPDEINIGSIVEDRPIYGGVDNELFIDGDIVIKCD